MNNSYWKKKCMALADANDLEFEFDPPSRRYGSPATGFCYTNNEERFWVATNGYSCAISGVEGYYNNLDWKEAFKYLSEDIKEGFYTLDEIKDEDPEEYERLCWDGALRHHAT